MPELGVDEYRCSYAAPVRWAWRKSSSIWVRRYESPCTRTGMRSTRRVALHDSKAPSSGSINSEDDRSRLGKDGERHRNRA